ncbi:MAG TPA: hypothetical protein VNF24_02265 [Candidatus Acidoferrales bacterium]|nr:hypothetical protein [Candidatus Acidoferrales bacterium]
MASSLILTRSGDPVKTAAQHAVTLARVLRRGDLTSVWVSDREHEALRDLVRARAEARIPAIDYSSSAVQEFGICVAELLPNICEPDFA